MVIYSQVISYTEAWHMTFEERKIVMDTLQEYHDAKSGKKGTEQL